MDKNNGWQEAKEFVRYLLKEHSKKLDCIDDKVNKLSVEIAKFKVKEKIITAVVAILLSGITTACVHALF